MNNNFYTSVLIGLLLLSFGCSNKKDGSTEEVRPNVLWIIADGLSPDLGCYGNEFVVTPNIDRLASGGVLYTNAFSTSSISPVSRSAIYTGFYPCSFGAHQFLETDTLPLPDTIRTAMHLFREAGYFVASGTDHPDMNALPLGLNFTADSLFDGSDWSQREPGQPFFAQVLLNDLERPFDNDPLNPVDTSQLVLPPYYNNDSLSKLDWKMYLESIQLLDSRLGNLISRLEQEELLDSTLIFFFGDHGRNHIWDTHWLTEGGIHVPLIVRLPNGNKEVIAEDKMVSLIDLLPSALAFTGIEMPEGLHGKNFLSDTVTEREFIFATRDRIGESFDRSRCIRSEKLKLVLNYHPEIPYTQFNFRKYVFYPMWSVALFNKTKDSIPTPQHKFLKEAKDPVELYHVYNDPFEVNNLFNDSMYIFDRDKLLGELKLWQHQVGDMGEKNAFENLQQLVNKRIFEKNQIMTERQLSPTPVDTAYINWWWHELNKSFLHDAI